MKLLKTSLLISALSVNPSQAMISDINDFVSNTTRSVINFLEDNKDNTTLNTAAVTATALMGGIMLYKLGTKVYNNYFNQKSTKKVYNNNPSKYIKDQKEKLINLPDEIFVEIADYLDLISIYNKDLESFCETSKEIYNINNLPKKYEVKTLKQLENLLSLEKVVVSIHLLNNTEEAKDFLTKYKDTNISSLKELNLSFSDLEGQEEDLNTFLKNNPQITILELNYCKLNNLSLLFKGLENTNIKDLNLSGNILTGKEKDLNTFLIKNPQINKLELSGCKLNNLSLLFKDLKDTNIKYLNLSWNNLEGQEEDLNTFLRNNPQITTLKLKNCYLNDLSILLDYLDNTHIEELDLSGNNLEGQEEALTTFLLNNPQITTLNLCNCKLKNLSLSLKELGKTNIQYLNLAFNNLEGQEEASITFLLNNPQIRWLVSGPSILSKKNRKLFPHIEFN